MIAFNKKVEFTAFGILILLVILIPLPYGSNRPWALSIVESSIFLMAVILVLNKIINVASNNDTDLLPKHLKHILYLFLSWICYQILLIVPLPIELVQYLSYTRYETHIATFPDYTSAYLSLSYDQFSSIKTVITNLAYVTLFLVAYQLCKTQKRIELMLWLIVLSGLAQALYGIVEMYSLQLSTIDKKFITHANTISGSFINRNHFSAFILFAIASTAALLLSSTQSRSFTLKQSSTKSFLSGLLDYRLHLKVYMFVFITAILYSQSRGAELGLVLALIFTIIFFLISRSNKIDKTLKIVIYLLPLIIFIIYMANDGWLNRFFFLLDNAPQRLVIWQVSLELYYNYWLTGVGPGNFQYLYPIYQPFGVEYHVDHAHNDYLELMTEQGITGLILLSLPIISVITLIAKNVTQRKTLYTSGVQLASLIALIAILLHASVDFLFQIPAITAYFFIYMAIALRSCQFKNG